MSRPTTSEEFLRQRLKVLRDRSGLTQGMISELAGISYDYYKDIEQGVRPNVSIRMVEQIAKVYGLSIHELFAPEVPAVKTKLKAVPSPHYKRRSHAGGQIKKSRKVKGAGSSSSESNVVKY